ncbi:MAG: hypothetical protein WCF85_16320 [Rhodospirillaceae bacterium]
MPSLRLHQLTARDDGRFPITIAWWDDGGSETHVDGLRTAGIDETVEQRAKRAETLTAELGELL